MRRIAPLALTGSAVGGVVAWTAQRFGAEACLSEAPALGPAGDCAGLVASLALRVGVLAGLAAVVIGLLALGLHRTAVQREELRRSGALDEGEG